MHPFLHQSCLIWVVVLLEVQRIGYGERVRNILGEGRKFDSYKKHVIHIQLSYHSIINFIIVSFIQQCFSFIDVPSTHLHPPTHPKSYENQKAQFPKLCVFVTQRSILNHYYIQTVKDRISNSSIHDEQRKFNPCQPVYSSKSQENCKNISGTISGKFKKTEAQAKKFGFLIKTCIQNRVTGYPRGKRSSESFIITNEDLNRKFHSKDRAILGLLPYIILRAEKNQSFLYIPILTDDSTWPVISIS